MKQTDATACVRSVLLEVLTGVTRQRMTTETATVTFLPHPVGLVAEVVGDGGKRIGKWQIMLRKL